MWRGVLEDRVDRLQPGRERFSFGLCDLCLGGGEDLLEVGHHAAPGQRCSRRARTASAIFCLFVTQAILILVCRLSGMSTVNRFVGSSGASGFGFRLTHSSWAVTTFLGWAI